MERKATHLCRKISYKISSFSVEEDTDKLEDKIHDLDVKLSELNKCIDQLDPTLEEYRTLQQECYQLNIGIKKLKEKVQDKKNKEILEISKNTGHVFIEMNLMEDRRMLTNVNKAAEDLLKGAKDVNTNLKGNNETLNRIKDKNMTINSLFQSAHSAMGFIKRQKVKHTVVLGIVTGLCLCFLIWWSLGR